MKQMINLAAALMLGGCAAEAAQAVLSKDSSHAYFLPDEQSKIVEIDLKKQTCREIDLTRKLNQKICGITLSASGFVLCATPHAVWSWNPANSACVKVCDVQDGVTLDDIAYDPSTGKILGTTAGDEIFSFPKNGSEWVEVGNRYGTGVDHPIFTGDGTLFFVSDGDLWSGVLADEDAGLIELTAYRSAPLGSLVNQNTSPASTGLRIVAVTKHFIYANYARMGGSGWGSVIRFHRFPLAATKNDGEWGVSVNSPGWKELSTLFGSVEEIADHPCEYLCGSMDGSMVLFANPYSESNEVFVIKYEGKPASLNIKGLAACFK